VAEKKTRTKSAKGTEKKVTRYTYENIKEPRTPETGHTSLLPSDEQVVTLPMDNGWSKAIQVGKLPEGGERTVVVDMDPAADPVLFWAGKRNRREVPVLPLQRNEIVAESRIAQIIERARKAAAEESGMARQGHLYADLEKTLRESDRSKRVEFYTHEEGWKNKLICGDSLHVMESLLHYENLRGKVQMIYIDPPYGIKYDSNFQQRVDSTKNFEKDAADDVLTIKAFLDTWALGIHSYLSYLQERLYLCRELLSSSGSLFLQINEENLHLVRNLMDEVLGRSNYIATISFKKSGSSPSALIGSRYDHLCWYAKSIEDVKARKLYLPKALADVSGYRYKESPSGEIIGITEEERQGSRPLPDGWKAVQLSNLSTEGAGNPDRDAYVLGGKTYRAGIGKHWKTSHEGINRILAQGRIVPLGSQLNYKRYFDDFAWVEVDSTWNDTGSAGYSSADPKVYAVQTDSNVIERCILLTTAPGEVVFDPTCGSGTSARCAERLGRRWITCDTSRVAVNVARQRLLSSMYEQFRTRNGLVSSGFVYKEATRITLKSLANEL
jgi:adenine-specific DNA-methyltransferase